MKFHVFFIYWNMASCMFLYVLIHDTYMKIRVGHKCLITTSIIENVYSCSRVVFSKSKPVEPSANN